MATKTDTSSEEQPRRIRPGAELFITRYYVELARFSTWLFSSIIIAMAFLLLGGLHTPKTLLLVGMYVALGALTLSLLTYVAAGFIDMWLASSPSNLSQPQQDMLLTQLKVARILQQVLFAIGLIAALGFAIEVSLLFFSAGTAAPAATPPPVPTAG